MRQMCVKNNVLSFGNSVTSLVIQINALIVEALEKQGFSKALLQVCCKSETFHIGS